MTDWIKCSDKVPNDDQKVIVYGENDIDIGYIHHNNEDDRYEVYYDYTPNLIVTHWMELPDYPND